ncbi:MAG: peptidoglycan-binding domain-containing protein [Candidatus Omnitrophota bacterium]|jgi:peptidoglycan hydrolase-like protein with peptidoglycan-binding domain
MARKGLILVLLVGFLFALSGCATGRKQKEMEIQGLRNQVSVLEAQIQAKDEEISSLRGRMLPKSKVVGEVKFRPKAKDVQIALRNAGYNPGAIDGRMGRQTRDAIRAFQRANNLSVDGKVGKQTWSLLKEYLYKKLK